MKFDWRLYRDAVSGDARGPRGGVGSHRRHVRRRSAALRVHVPGIEDAADSAHKGHRH
jgi:hypothetical protein